MLDMEKLAETDPEAYRKEVELRYGLPLKKPGSPDCTEPGCKTGVVMLMRDQQNRLVDYAYCLLCGRRYVVLGVEERRRQEGF